MTTSAAMLSQVTASAASPIDEVAPQEKLTADPWPRRLAECLQK